MMPGRDLREAREAILAEEAVEVILAEEAAEILAGAVAIPVVAVEVAEDREEISKLRMLGVTIALWNTTPTALPKRK
jgi:hypothetical protein